MGLLRPGTPGLLLLLALIGGGLGLFTAPNNATIMGSVPPQQAGMASGVLNMSRGIGTALGLALTGLLFAVNGGVGGGAGGAGGAGHAFTVTALVLAGIAGGAGVVASVRSDDVKPVQ
jgi:MFS family permease